MNPARAACVSSLRFNVKIVLRIYGTGLAAAGRREFGEMGKHCVGTRNAVVGLQLIPLVHIELAIVPAVRPRLRFAVSGARRPTELRITAGGFSSSSIRILTNGSCALKKVVMLGKVVTCFLRLERV